MDTIVEGAAEVMPPVMTDRSGCRESVLEEAAALMKKRFEKAMASAKYYKAKPHDDGSYGVCLTEASVWQEAEIALRAMKQS